MLEPLMAILHTCHEWLAGKLGEDVSKEIVSWAVPVFVIAGVIGMYVIARYLVTGLRLVVKLGARPFSDAHLPLSPLVAQTIEWLSSGSARTRDGVVLGPVDVSALIGSSMPFDEYVRRWLRNRTSDCEVDDKLDVLAFRFRVNLHTRNGDKISVFPYVNSAHPILATYVSNAPQPDGTHCPSSVQLYVRHMNKRELRLLRAAATKIVEQAVEDMEDAEARKRSEACRVAYEQLVRKT